MYVVFVVGWTVRVPDPVPRLPILSITKKAVSGRVVHESVEESPDVIVEGFAERVQVGPAEAGSEHDALVPTGTPVPLQFHDHGPVEPPVLFLESPVAHPQWVSGSGLQEPLTVVTGFVSEHEALVPPPEPLHFHVHAREPSTLSLDSPAEQSYTG